MAFEQSKAAKRRYYDGAFHSRYFVGVGLDIGAGDDSLGRYINVFRGIQRVDSWDLTNGDAQKLEGVANNSYDFIHSSHCLEHMQEYWPAALRWIQVVKPGGFLIITVPHWQLYERGHWPSKFNNDHKHRFAINHRETGDDWEVVGVVKLSDHLSHLIDVERIVLHNDFFDPTLPADVDQTRLPNAECSIEMIWRKKP